MGFSNKILKELQLHPSDTLVQESNIKTEECFPTSCQIGAKAKEGISLIYGLLVALFIYKILLH